MCFLESLSKLQYNFLWPFLIVLKAKQSGNTAVQEKQKMTYFHNPRSISKWALWAL